MPKPGQQHARRVGPAATAILLLLSLAATAHAQGLPQGTKASAPSATSPPASAAIQIAKQLRLAIAKCWQDDGSAPPAQARTTLIEFDLKRSGALLGAPRIINRRGEPTPVAIAQSAIKAIQTCQPYTNLPVDQYETAWRRVRMTFDAKGF